MNFQTIAYDKLGISLNETQLNQFEKYFLFLTEYNKVTNLTRILEKDDVYFKHFFDSLTIAKTVDINGINTIADMGSGAGFPGIPLKIAFPHLKITLIDSLGKRTEFLKKLVIHLGLRGVDIINSRVEDYAKQALNVFDLVTARAFSKMPIFLELACPIAKEKGFVLAMKGRNYQRELVMSSSIMKKMKITLLKSEEFELPFQYGNHTNLLFQKNGHVSGYPRKYSVILKEVEGFEL